MEKVRTAVINWLRAFWTFAKSSPATALALAICTALMVRIALIQLRCLPLPLVMEEQQRHHTDERRMAAVD